MLEFMLAESTWTKLPEFAEQNPLCGYGTVWLLRFGAARRGCSQSGQLPAWKAWIAVPFLLMLPAQFMMGYWTGKTGDDSLVKRAMAANEKILEDTIGVWSRVKFEEVKRDHADDFAENSRTFTYRHGKLCVEVLVSLDFPYDGWHDLCICYEVLAGKSRNGVRRGRIVNVTRCMGLRHCKIFGCKGNSQGALIVLRHLFGRQLRLRVARRRSTHWWSRFPWTDRS